MYQYKNQENDGNSSSNVQGDASFLRDKSSNVQGKSSNIEDSKKRHACSIIKKIVKSNSMDYMVQPALKGSQIKQVNIDIERMSNVGHMNLHQS